MPDDGQRALDEFDGDGLADLRERVADLEDLVIDVVGTVEDLAAVNEELVENDDVRDPTAEAGEQYDDGPTGRGFQ